MEKKSLAIHFQLINCTVSEVAAMIEGAMRHCTTMDVEVNYADSQGQSEIGFGITGLLNFDLPPRIKRINKVKLYRPVAGEPDAYPQLTPALTRPVRWELIAQQYDQMIKYATEIRTRTGSTEAILRRELRDRLRQGRGDRVEPARRAGDVRPVPAHPAIGPGLREHSDAPGHPR
ncbi:Tn3 family transposase [Streptomyces edwardsiae]|uniref:Tn3 family transposase n=1 Tax=Streptomyces edwardsiae TaxID=3075527 RepID=A0ABU2QPT7_9ACTN|nr:Tn3 family transposase [Streptomyces sp. DSM 41635]MDT0405239.1 Tn3 family transposase [Streptomyces sp. DSM 41635]